MNGMAGSHGSKTFAGNSGWSPNTALQGFNQSAVGVSNSQSPHGPQGIPALDLPPLTVGRFLLQLFSSRFWYALRLAMHTAHGNMTSLLATKYWGIDLGPYFERLGCGCYVANERTDARSCGTRELLSRYPWANTVLLGIYLEGFDKGERYAMNSNGKAGQVSPQSYSHHQCFKKQLL